MEFKLNDQVTVTKKRFDHFATDFCGQVIDFNKIDGLIFIKDLKTGSVWACSSDQLDKNI